MHEFSLLFTTDGCKCLSQASKPTSSSRSRDVIVILKQLHVLLQDI